MKNHSGRRDLQATALKYDPLSGEAPIIVALGLGHVAEKVIETAKEHDIPIVEDKPLSNILAGLSVGDTIPPKLYEAVARILVFVSQKDSEFRAKLTL